MHVTPQDLLGVGSIRRILTQLDDQRELGLRLDGVAAVPLVPASDKEITLYVSQRVPMAQIVLDGARFRPVSHQANTQIVNSIVNIKTGHQFTEDELQSMNRLFENSANDADGASVAAMVTRNTVAVNRSLNERLNHLIYGMWLDAYTYDVDGVKLVFSWGKPSDLKVTAGVLWSDPTNATPVTDVSAVQELASRKYGVVYDTLRMPLVKLNQMTATAEFKNQARSFLVTDNNFPVPQVRRQRLAEQILGLREGGLIIDDTAGEQESNGAIATLRNLPTNQVLFQVSTDAGRADVHDVGNGVLTESIITQMLGQLGTASPFGALPAGTRGPILFPMVEQNPPTMTLAGVIRGFPRFFRPERTAVLSC